jgi:hypothetical protein
MMNFKTKIRIFTLLLVPFAVSVFASDAAENRRDSRIEEISESVTSLGYGAYRNRKDLVLVTVPYSVNSIDKNAFFNCPNLLSITFDDDIGWYVTQDARNWQNRTMGTRVDVTDPSANAAMFRTGRYYFYKVESDVW